MKVRKIEDFLNLEVEEKTYKVKSRESCNREFKESFVQKDLVKYFKIMAGLANNSGGVLIFGVKNKPNLLTDNIKEDLMPDDQIISSNLPNYFEPHIHYTTVIREILDRRIFAIIVQENFNKPVIAKKNYSVIEEKKGKKQDVQILREGAIYCRYGTETLEIKYPELKSIIDSQVEKVFKSLVEQINIIKNVGYDKAVITNAKDLSENSNVASVYITNEIAKNMNWIDSGNFTKTPKDGKNAFYVTRTVELKHGIKSDYSDSHKYTKKDFAKIVKINSIYLDSVFKELRIYDNKKDHVITPHGKNRIHKINDNAKRLVLEKYPLDMKARDEQIKKIYKKYTQKTKE